jgi:hypothetical protein
VRPFIPPTEIYFEEIFAGRMQISHEGLTKAAVAGESRRALKLW